MLGCPGLQGNDSAICRTHPPLGCPCTTDNASLLWSYGRYAALGKMADTITPRTHLAILTHGIICTFCAMVFYLQSRFKQIIPTWTFSPFWNTLPPINSSGNDWQFTFFVQRRRHILHQIFQRQATIRRPEPSAFFWNIAAGVDLFHFVRCYNNGFSDVTNVTIPSHRAKLIHYKSKVRAGIYGTAPGR